MNKPKSYDKVSIGYAALTPGGHKCEIKEVQETKAKSGKDMLVIAIDTDKDDPQGGYFRDRYLEDKEAKRDAKWRGNMYLVVDENTDYGPANLKRFVTAVEGSNDGFQVEWGDAFSKCFKGKKVGVIFGEEEYMKNDNTVGTSVKPLWFCNYDKAFDQKVPEKRTLAPAVTAAAEEGFMQVPDSLNDEGLPFG